MTISADVARCTATIETHSGLIAMNSNLIEECKATVAVVEASGRAIADDVNDLSCKVIRIEDELTSYKKSCCNEEFVREATERIRRSNNIILRGLSETSDNDLEGHDLARVGEILESIDASCVSALTSVNRLGRFQGTPRPLKLCFSDPKIPLTLLRNKVKLSVTHFKEITLSDDKTPQQLRQLAELRKELKQRQENGDSNCTIKYVKGIPLIVSSKLPKN